MGEGKVKEALTCDLVLHSRRLITFLQEIHDSGASLKPVTAESIRRYTDLWLPLVASCDNNTKRPNPRHKDDDITSPVEPLLPPPDVAWLWHCHRLAPLAYEKYVQNRFGDKILEARPPFEFQHEVDPTDRAQKLWSKLYPKDPFYASDDDLQQFFDDYDEEKKDGSMTDTSYDDDGNVPSLDGFDLAAASSQQATFLWHVSVPIFFDEASLRHAMEQYAKFLHLFKIQREQQLQEGKGGDTKLLVPTCPIDLMWRTHMLLSTSDYLNDCLRLTGGKFDHSGIGGGGSTYGSWGHNPTRGAEAIRAFQHTSDLWMSVYDGEEYGLAGGMYRGEPSAAYFRGEIPSESCPDALTPVEGLYFLPSNEFLVVSTHSSDMDRYGTPGASSDIEDPCDLRSFSSEPLTTEAVISLKEPGVSPREPDVSSPEAVSSLPEPVISLPESLSPVPEPAPKRRTPSAVQDPFDIEGYIFGIGSLGEGLYSLRTAEAYTILEKRLAQQLNEAENEESEARIWEGFFTCGVDDEEKCNGRATSSRAHGFRTIRAFCLARAELPPEHLDQPVSHRDILEHGGMIPLSAHEDPVGAFVNWPWKPTITWDDGRLYVNFSDKDLHDAGRFHGWHQGRVDLTGPSTSYPDNMPNEKGVEHRDGAATSNGGGDASTTGNQDSQDVCVGVSGRNKVVDVLEALAAVGEAVTVDQVLSREFVED